MTTAGSKLAPIGPSVWRVLVVTAMSVMLCGCHCLDFHTTVQANAKVAGDFNGKFKVETTQFPDHGPMVPRVVRCAGAGEAAGRIAIVDIDGLIVNQNLTGMSSAGENPVAAFREKLILAASDPAVRAVVLRINSPGGGVAASEIMAEELRRFRLGTGKPVVACLMDLATGGAYYIAVGTDLIVAQPSGITGSIGAVANFYNLELAMSTVNVTVNTVKSSEMVDMGSVLRTMEDEEKAIFQEIVHGHAQQFQARVASLRPAMTAADNLELNDDDCDLRLMSSVKDVGDIPPGKNLMVVAAVDNVLHFRRFDGVGKVVLDKDEKALPKQVSQIEELRRGLVGLWPPHQLSGSEKFRVRILVTSIVGGSRQGRIVPAIQAVRLHLVDRLGFLEDAIEEAERRSGLQGAEVVLLQRANLPIRSIYAIAPNTPIQNTLVPVSLPGIDRSKLPTFLYLWQPDPTITRVAPP